MGAFTKLGTCASGLCALGSRNAGTGNGHHRGAVTTPLTVPVEPQNQEVPSRDGFVGGLYYLYPIRELTYALPR